MRCYMFLLCITITHEYKPFIFLSFLDSFRICKDPELPRSVFGAFSIPRYTSASVYPVLLASMHVEGAIAARGTLSEFAQKHTMPAHTICELQRHHLQDSICHLLQSTPKYSTRDEHATNRDMILRDLRGDLHVIHILCTYCTWYWYNSATVPVGAKKCLDSPRPPRLSRRLRTLSWPETVNFIDKHLVKISKDSSIHEYHELFWRLNMFK